MVSKWCRLDGAACCADCLARVFVCPPAGRPSRTCCPSLSGTCSSLGTSRWNSWSCPCAATHHCSRGRTRNTGTTTAGRMCSQGLFSAASQWEGSSGREAWEGYCMQGQTMRVQGCCCCICCVCVPSWCGWQGSRCLWSSATAFGRQLKHAWLFVLYVSAPPWCQPRWQSMLRWGVKHKQLCVGCVRVHPAHAGQLLLGLA